MLLFVLQIAVTSQTSHVKFLNTVASTSLGGFNAGDKVLIALDTFLEWREFFKKGVPLSTLIECILNSLLLTVPEVCAS